ncbi:PD-(D/E)XK nuclease family protein [Actinomadura roseirufa]|uniref:PD-(D/E)XK nuclease family protein n=1 Tax=Actinomadura roseirufa TaxID=2094049 RepID=UPI00104143DC|nr:PD-(D/E)XK nuclease family protein [Actinomadura roseirufa]
MTPHKLWTMPSGLRGEPLVIRLSASALDHDGRQCGDFAALKARPRVWPSRREPARYPPWESFPLGLVMGALDRVESTGVDVGQAVEQVIARTRSTVHAGVRQWVGHACDAYLRAGEWIAEELEAEGVALVPEQRPRVVQHESAAELRLLTAWGRWYASADGAVREFRRLRMSRAGARDALSNDVLAFVAAAGLRAEGSVYRDLPVEVVPDGREPERIRVVEVMLTAGVPPRVLVDAHPGDVRRTYQEKARHHVSDIVFGGGKRPGSDCAGCKASSSCEALRRVPGLLGIQDTGTHRRTWSVTTGRQYLVCPAQAHLRELRLPAASWSDGSAAGRGRAVHRWLEAAHARYPVRACEPGDLPEPDAPELGPAAELMTREEYHEARPFLLAHLATCPLGGPGAVTDVEPEPNVAVHDPAADVLVVAQPDLIRKVDGRVVYREQKTTLVPAPDGTMEDVIARVPQLALAVRLVAHQVFGGDGGGVVELETLTPSAAEVLSFDVADPAVREAARKVLVRMTADWHKDTVFRATPGHWCAACPVAQWCPDRAPSDPKAPIVVDGVRIDPRTGEVLAGAAAVSHRAAAVSASLTEPDHGDEPVPF